MNLPYYVTPEQITKDKADFARKGISRGRSVIVMQCQEGILLVAQNGSKSLHKVAEIYDRIAFAAVGKYNEFESLRQAGVRFADLRGYTYARSDVNARSLANAYAQTMGSIFTEAAKPLEVEIVVAEVGDSLDEDQIYVLSFDGSVADKRGYLAIGGAAEDLNTSLAAKWNTELDLSEAVQLAVTSLRKNVSNDGSEGQGFDESELEVALLERKLPRRKFRRILANELTSLIAG
ncbi:MAG: proteasome subunit alpha [Candidatus Nanopelagicales bacterium]